MSILYSACVLAEEFKTWSHLDIITILCLQFILTFAFLPGIQSFIWCLMEGLLE